MFIRRILTSHIRRRALILAAIPLFSLLSLFTPFFTQNALAITAGEVLDRARAWSILNAVIEEASLLDYSISNSDAEKCAIFGSNDNDTVYVGHHVTGKNDASVISGASWDALEDRVDLANGALASVGIQGGCRGLLEKIGYVSRDGSMYSTKDFNNGEPELVAKIRAAVAPGAFYGANIGDGAPGDAISYAMLYYLLTKVCGWEYRNPYVWPDSDPANQSRNNEAHNNGWSGDSNSSHFHTYTYENGRAGENTYYKGGGRTDDIYVGAKTGFASSGSEQAQIDCGDNNADTVGAKLGDNHRYADAYAELIRPGGANTAGTCGEKYPPGADPARNELLRAACDEGFKNKGVAGYCNKYGDPGEKAACEYGQGTATGGANDVTPTPAGEDEKTQDKTTCAIAGIGWLVCPVLNLMAQIVDGAYNFVALFLTVQPLTTDAGSLLFKAWSTMRNFANVAFVIAFLVIIFSQVTSFGISNYGIKRMLPRLIVAAILVNISFWVCAVAVDLSNIAGTSVKALFDAIGQGFTLPNAEGTFSTSSTWAGLVGTLLSGGLLIGAALFIGLSALLPVLVACLFAILVVFLTLIIRQALIILLIVISPLAFVAYLLPNTESLFNKWRRMFTMLLLMFPIISLIFGASALASKIVMGS